MRRGEEALESEGSDTTVFFSYSRVDREEALAIIEWIEASGYSVWWDGMLEGGAEFLKDTEAALENANAVVVLWSKNAIGSHWVRDEATSGRQRDRLIPLSLDGSLPPLGFRQFQAIDMRGWRRTEDAKAQILKRLAALHDRPVLGLNRQTHLDPAPLPRRKSVSRRALLVGGGVIGLGAVAIAAGLRLKAPDSRGDIAVLPFENLLGDESLDYLSHGLASAIRDHLARNRALKVIARSSSQEVFNETSDARRIAQMLNVNHVLEGRLERLGSERRLSVNLIAGQGARVIWTETFPFSEASIVPLLDAIIQNLVKRLAGEARSEDVAITKNPAAYDAYMRGEDLMDQRGSLSAIRDAKDYFQRAVEIDPDFGLAHAALANQLLILGVIDDNKAQSRELIEAALRSAQTGVSKQPGYSTTHAVLGQVRASGRLDFSGAQDAFLTAQDLGFSNSSDRSRFALFESSVGNPEVALQTMREGVRLDPLNPSMYEVLAYVTYASGDFDGAAELYRTVLEMDPNRYTVRAWLGLSEIYRGDPMAGLEMCSDEKNLMERLTCEAIAYGKIGDQDAANARFEELVESFGDAAAYQQAQIEAQAGQYDEAMETLRLAEALEDTGLSMVMTDPALNPLRERDDFNALLARRGLRD